MNDIEKSVEDELQRGRELLGKKMQECAGLYKENAKLKAEMEALRNVKEAEYLDRIETFLSLRHPGLKEIRIVFRK